MSVHRCLDLRAGMLRLDSRGRCFWCGEQIAPTPPLVPPRRATIEPAWFGWWIDAGLTRRIWVLTLGGARGLIYRRGWTQ